MPIDRRKHVILVISKAIDDLIAEKLIKGPHILTDKGRVNADKLNITVLPEEIEPTVAVILNSHDENLLKLIKAKLYGKL